jgi:hypothetical protein
LAGGEFGGEVAGDAGGVGEGFLDEGAGEGGLEDGDDGEAGRGDGLAIGIRNWDGCGREGGRDGQFGVLGGDVGWVVFGLGVGVGGEGGDGGEEVVVLHGWWNCEGLVGEGVFS